MNTPIIMETNIQEVGKKLAILRERNEKRVHIDIGDGLFSDMFSIAPADLQELDLSGLEIDLHLLVDDPTEWIEESVALSPKRLIGQIERMGSQANYIENVLSYGIVAGLALKIETPIEEIEAEVLDKCGVILLLAVPAGSSGSKFDERVLPKIAELRKVYHGSILIDGGINKDTSKKVMASGGTETGANSAYWRGEM
ncbi:MAG: hypothetical protein WCG44_01000 [bacterium]